MKYQITIDRGPARSAISFYGPVGQQPRTLTRPALRAFLSRFKVFNATGQLSLLDEIGELGIDAQHFARDLAAIDGTEQIDLFVNSPGGNVFDGLAIYSMLNRHPARKVAYVDGVAASIASVICMACEEIVISAPAKMMIHNALGGAGGESGELRKMADLLDEMSETIAGVYSARTGIAPATIQQLMARETWFSAAEAVDAGLADRIAPLKGRDADDLAMVAERRRSVTSYGVAARLREIRQHATELAALDHRRGVPHAAVMARVRQVARHRYQLSGAYN